MTMVPDPMTSYEIAKLRHQEAVVRANRRWQLEGYVNHPASHNFLRWLRQQKINLRQWRKQRILKQAILRAYQTFAKRHPRWVASLFDEYFLMGSAPLLMTSDAQGDRLQGADELVAVWANQLGPLAPSPDSLNRSEARSVALDFLKDLANELRHSRNFNTTNKRGWSKLSADQSIRC